MDLGLLLVRFFIDFGPNLGGKLGPSWHQVALKTDPKTNQKIDHILQRLLLDF